jgi:hypothetical protein
MRITGTHPGSLTYDRRIPHAMLGHSVHRFMIWPEPSQLRHALPPDRIRLIREDEDLCDVRMALHQSGHMRDIDRDGCADAELVQGNRSSSESTVSDSGATRKNTHVSMPRMDPNVLGRPVADDAIPVLVRDLEQRLCKLEVNPNLSPCGPSRLPPLVKVVGVEVVHLKDEIKVSLPLCNSHERNWMIAHLTPTHELIPRRSWPPFRIDLLHIDPNLALLPALEQTRVVSLSCWPISQKVA